MKNAVTKLKVWIFKVECCGDTWHTWKKTELARKCYNLNSFKQSVKYCTAERKDRNHLTACLVKPAFNLLSGR